MFWIYNRKGEHYVEQTGKLPDLYAIDWEGDLYNVTQSDDDVKSGDLFLITHGDDEITIVLLNQAWPQVIFGKRGTDPKQLHGYTSTLPALDLVSDALKKAVTAIKRKFGPDALGL